MRESLSLRGRLIVPFLIIFLFVILYILFFSDVFPTGAALEPQLSTPNASPLSNGASNSIETPLDIEQPERSQPVLTPVSTHVKTTVTRFLVSTTRDDVDAHPGDGVCASSNGECTLRAAIQEANTNPDASLILLPKGIFRIDIPGSGEDAGASGDFDVLTSLTIDGAGEGLTILSGEGLDRVLDIGEPGRIGVPVTISNLTIQDGTDNGANAPGGVRIRAFTVLLEHVAVIDHIGEGIGVNEGELTLNDSRVSGNVGIGVGGIRASASSLWITRSSIDHNSGAWGGLSSDTRLTMNAATVSHNRATTGPGGMRLVGTALIINSTISGNEGSEGGGIWADRGEIMLLNSTITDNQARGSGGDWRSGTGGGIFFQNSRGSVLLQNSILSANRASSGKAECRGTLSSGGNNLLGNMQGCDFSRLKSDIVQPNPLLGPLQDNGGGTFTHALRPGSPAVDAGDPAGCKTSEAGLLNFDQRGKPRPAFAGATNKPKDGKARCDIGAYELQGALPLASPLPISTPIGTRTPVRPDPTWIPITPLVPLTITPQPILSPLLTPPQPSNCREAIRNGGFEDTGGWTFPVTTFSAAYDANQAHSGKRSVRTGILSPLQNKLSYSSVWQEVNIPPGTGRATLTFWVYPFNSGPIEDYNSGDLQLALVVDHPPAGDFRPVVRETLLSARSDSRAWTLYQYDLTKYAGQTVWLYFGTYNNGWAASWGSPMAMFVDDVSVKLCQP